MYGELLRTLSVQTSLSGLVLCDLVQCVLPAVLVFAVSSLCLWNVHLQHRDARSISCNVLSEPANCYHVCYVQHAPYCLTSPSHAQKKQ